MASPELPHIELSDAPAQWFCLACGNRYTRPVERCGDCGRTGLTARETLEGAVRASLPESDPSDLDLAFLGWIEEPAQRRAIEAGLRGDRIPFLTLSEELVPAGADDGDRIAFYVPARDVRRVHARSVTWLEAAPAAAAEGVGDAPPGKTLLVIAHNADEVTALRRLFGDARVGFETRAAATEGLVPDFTPLAFFVADGDLDRADAVLDQFEAELGAPLEEDWEPEPGAEPADHSAEDSAAEDSTAEPAGVEVKLPRFAAQLDLTDPQAAYFCLACGDAYVREVPSCRACGESVFAPRADIEFRAAASVTGTNVHESTLQLLGWLPTSDSARSAVASLRDAGAAHLLIDEQRRIVAAPPASGGVAVFVRVSDVKRARGLL